MSVTIDENSADTLRRAGILECYRVANTGEVTCDYYNRMARVDDDARVTFNGELEANWTLKDCIDAGWLFEAHPCTNFWNECMKSKYSIECAARSINLHTTNSACINLARVATMIEALQDAGKQTASDWLSVTAYDRLKYVAREGSREYTSVLGARFEAPHSRTVLSGEDEYSFGFKWFNAMDPKQLDSDFQLRRQTIERAQPDEYKHGYYFNDFLHEQKVAVPEQRLVNQSDDLTYTTFCKHDESHNERAIVHYKFAGFGGIIDRWSRDIWKMEQWPGDHLAYSVHT